jgi:hypothetical protein
VCEQNRSQKLEWGYVEEDEGFGLGVGGFLEVEKVAVWAEAADDGGTRRGFEGAAFAADGDFAVVADADSGLLAPDVGPPRASWDGAQDRPVFGEGLRAGGVGRLAEFAMDFVLVDMGQELVEEVVGGGEVVDLIGGQERGQAFLPVVMAAFDFALGVGRELHPMRIKQNSSSRSSTPFIRGAVSGWS